MLRVSGSADRLDRSGTKVDFQTLDLPRRRSGSPALTVRPTPGERIRPCGCVWAVPDRDRQAFYVENGSILKLAASHADKGFIDDFVAWGVNPILAGPADDRIVLDYVGDEMARRGGSTVEPGLRRCSRTLRNAGARNRRELSDTIYTRTVDPVP